MTPKDVLKLAKEKGVKIVDLRFIDLPGLWQHFSIPMSELSEGIFEDGLGVRRLVDPRLPDHRRVRHAADPGSRRRRRWTRSPRCRRWS